MSSETHLGEEHRENSQADPVDDAGKLECIVNCRDETEQLIIFKDSYYDIQSSYMLHNIDKVQ